MSISMTRKLSFKEYYDSKVSLLCNATSIITFETVHLVNKYCKVPVLQEHDRTSISLKPNDLITIKWQRVGDAINFLELNVGGNTHIPLWHAAKMKAWIMRSSTQCR